MKTRLFILVWLVLCGGTAVADSLTLSPAVVPLGGQLGQSTKQQLTLFNGTSHDLAFELHARDVVVRDGKRVFVAAGEIAGSVAATAVFSTRQVTLAPGQQRSVDVTLSLPREMKHRAVVILFQGTTKIGGTTAVSIGSLLTFDISGTTSVAAGDLRATAPTLSRNAEISLPVVNDGTEPTIVRAAIALVDAAGSIRGKLSLQPMRLLPGEQTTLRSDYPGVLAAGGYRVIATVQSGSRSWTRTTELGVR